MRKTEIAEKTSSEKLYIVIKKNKKKISRNNTQFQIKFSLCDFSRLSAGIIFSLQNKKLFLNTCIHDML